MHMVRNGGDRTVSSCDNTVSRLWRDTSMQPGEPSPELTRGYTLLGIDVSLVYAVPHAAERRTRYIRPPGSLREPLKLEDECVNRGFDFSRQRE